MWDLTRLDPWSRKRRWLAFGIFTAMALTLAALATLLAAPLAHGSEEAVASAQR